MTDNSPDSPASGGRILIEAVDPDSGKMCEIELSHRRVDAVATRSLGHANECAHLVPFTLQQPRAIFEGLTEEADEDRRGVGWLCYCSKPPFRFDEAGNRLPSRENRVFLVFVNAQRIAYTWRWEKSDSNEPDMPERHESRFRRRAL